MDVSIRPGWFYHAAEDAKVKTVDRLLAIYHQSVGRGANLLLNIPPDQRGLIPDIDAERLRSFRQALDEMYRTDLAAGAKASASSARGGSSTFAAALVNDGKAGTYWATDDRVTSGSVTLTFAKPTRFERVVLQEFIRLGQRVEAFTVEAEVDGAWKTVAEGTTIGYKRIVRCEPTTAARVRVNITRARACPTLATVAVY